MSNIGVVVLAQQIADRATARAIAENWKMSNIEVKQLLWTVDYRDQKWSLADLQAMIVNGAEHLREWIYDMLRVREDWQLLEQIKVWQAPVFPINGNDLIEIGFKPGPQIGSELQKLKQRWIESNFTLTAEQLLSEK
jgi:tRNA nucleotidyltransferase/poly(A) polymerase